MVMKMSKEVRGVYFHLDAQVYDSPRKIQDIENIFKELSELGITLIFPLAKNTRSQVYYPSRFLKNRVFKNIDFLDTVTRIAHEYNMEVHPQYCVFSHGEDFMKNHPEWAFTDRSGVKKNFVCPSSIEAREFEKDIVREIIDNYDIDGISLDYIRSPHGVCYCEKCTSKFKSLTGIDPNKIEDWGDEMYGWWEWQRLQITNFVDEIGEIVHEKNLKLSAYVWTTSARWDVIQDWPAWVRRKLLDFIIPTGYVYSLDMFSKIVREDLIVVRNIIPMYICIGVRTSHGFIENAFKVMQYIDIVRRYGLPGYVFFSLPGLLPLINDLKNII